METSTDMLPIIDCSSICFLDFYLAIPHKLLQLFYFVSAEDIIYLVKIKFKQIRKNAIPVIIH